MGHDETRRMRDRVDAAGRARAVALGVADTLEHDAAGDAFTRQRRTYRVTCRTVETLQHARAGVRAHTSALLQRIPMPKVNDGGPADAGPRTGTWQTDTTGC